MDTVTRNQGPSFLLIDREAKVGFIVSGFTVKLCLYLNKEQIMKSNIKTVTENADKQLRHKRNEVQLQHEFNLEEKTP